MLKIAVIGGGYSAEREISLRSATNVYEALLDSGYDAEFIDMTDGTNEDFIESLRNYNLVLPMLHGKGGEDGSLQKLLEGAGIKYFGSDSESSKKAFDKAVAKGYFESAAIKVPEGQLVDINSFTGFVARHSKFVLKPLDEGSSVGTIICRDGKYSDFEVANLFKKYGQMLAEELIEGIEITVPILGDKALPPVAIFPPENEEFDLENKYNGKTSEVCPIPENILTNEIQHLAKNIAEEVHEAIGARHFSRVDMIVSKENEIFTLELNTIPGMTSESLYPKSAKAAGISMKDLVKNFVFMSIASK